MGVHNRLEFTDDELDEMESMYRGGMSTVAIADHFGCLPGSISTRLKARGVKARKGRAARPFTWHETEHGYVVYGSTYLHRIVAAAWLGRGLRPGEVVHHRNGDKQDNRPENLEVMSSGEHATVHMQEWTPEDDWLLTRLRDAGRTAQEIADTLGVGKSSVNNRAKKLLKAGRISPRTGANQFDGRSPLPSEVARAVAEMSALSMLPGDTLSHGRNRGAAARRAWT